MLPPFEPDVPTVDPADLDPAAPVPAGTTLLDVREPDEWDGGHAPGAVHIPLGDLPVRYGELDPDTHIVVMCHSGGRSARATQFLIQAVGFEASNLDGGIVAWQRAGLAVVTG